MGKENKWFKGNVLNIDKDSILVVYVDVSAQPPAKVDKYCKKIIKKMLLKRKSKHSIKRNRYFVKPTE